MTSLKLYFFVCPRLDLFKFINAVVYLLYVICFIYILYVKDFIIGEFNVFKRCLLIQVDYFGELCGNTGDCDGF